jgi:hypothetical protein
MAAIVRHRVTSYHIGQDNHIVTPNTAKTCQNTDMPRIFGVGYLIRIGTKFHFCEILSEFSHKPGPKF